MASVDLQKLCRFEIEAGRIETEESIPDPDTGTYQYTLADLTASLDRCLQEENPEAFLLQHLGPVLDLISRGKIHPEYNAEEGDDSTALPDENNVFKCAFTLANRMYYGDGSLTAAFIRNEISVFENNRDKPDEKRILTQKQKEYFADYWHRRFPQADGKIISLYRRYLEELCADNDINGLDKYAEALYWGNGYYDADHIKAEEILKKCRSMTADPRYDDLLGDIYREGACSKGVSDYEREFQCRSMAGAAGNKHSLCRLAEMYRLGQGTAVNEQLCANIAKKVYDSEIACISRSYVNTDFAYAAAMMGDLYRYGVGRDCCPEHAYEFYLLAQKAASRLLKPFQRELGRIPDIDAKVQEVLPLTSYVPLKETCSTDDFHNLLQFCLYDLHLRMKAEITQDSLLRITAASRLSGTEKDMPVVVPECGWAGVLSELILVPKDITGILSGGKKEFYFTSAILDRLYDGMEQTALIRTELVFDPSLQKSLRD